MNTKAQLAISFLAGVVTTATVFYILDRPSTFAECVLASGPAGSDLATSLIAQACRAKFPAEHSRNQPEHSISYPESLLTLDGRAEPAYGNTFKGRLYNASDQETITQAEIALMAFTARDTVTRVYRTSVYIPPRSADEFSFEAVLGQGDYYTVYSWRVVGAKGFRSAR